MSKEPVTFTHSTLSEDPEIQAIEVCNAMLERIVDHEAAGRVVEYLQMRHGQRSAE